MGQVVLLVTGAAGYLGQRVVNCALRRGHAVKAVVRAGRDVSRMSWAGKAGVEVIEIDLATTAAVGMLAAALKQADGNDVVVVHAAGALVGGDEVQQCETVEPTRRIVQAMQEAGRRRLILLSSLSVYGYSAMPEGAQLDETSPTEPDPAARDAYCRAKLAQEAIALEAAQLRGLLVTALRPGVIFGPGRLWTARLGIAVGRLAVLLGGNAVLPLSFVEHCAQAVVLAAESGAVASDFYAERDSLGRLGAFEVINVVDDEQPTQRRYAHLLTHTDARPTLALRLPWGLLKRVVAAFAWAGVLAPGMSSRLPSLLRPASLHARGKPLRYSNCRLHDRLGWVPARDCASAVMASTRSEVWPWAEADDNDSGATMASRQ